MSCPPPWPAGRAPRIRATEYTPVALRYPSGDSATGSLEIFSATGGLLRLSKPLMKGTRIKLMFVAPSGPVFCAAEMLSPISRTEQPFRFVAFAHDDQGRLQATINQPPPKAEMPIPVQTDADTADVTPPKFAPYQKDQWIDKYRDAMGRNPPPRPLLKRMLAAIAPGRK
jgi:hypothetical protein